jgi:hypothetical protein
MSASIDIWLYPDDGDRSRIAHSNIYVCVYDFITCTHALSRFFGRGPAIKGWDEGSYVEIIVPAFCELVEDVFHHPQVLTFNWARIAASCYEIIHEEAFLWEWPVNKLPNQIGSWIDQDYVPIVPRYSSDEAEDEIRSPEKMPGRRHIRGVPENDGAQIILSAKASGKMLGSLPAQDAHLFYEMMVGLTHFVGLPTICLEMTDQGCLVEEVSFSLFVERVATLWMNIYFQWFRIAIAVYNNIHEMRPIWNCDVRGGILENGADDPINVEPLFLPNGRYNPDDETMILPRPEASRDWRYVYGPEE